jgi:hypothetical protein
VFAVSISLRTCFTEGLAAASANCRAGRHNPAEEVVDGVGV